MPVLLEVIVQSVEDARAAARGGADRLEVVRAIRDGGLTPPVALVRAIAAAVALPLRVMIVAGGGVDEEMLARIAQRGCVAEVHVGRAARADADPESPVSAAHVARLRELTGAR